MSTYLSARDVERHILDRHHQQQPLLARPEYLALGHLLKIVGDTLRDFGAQSDNYTDLQLRQTLACLTRGLAQSVRWILFEGNKSPDAKSTDWGTLDREALQMLVWGGHYAQLVTDHVIWSRGFNECTFDKALRRISFRPVSTFDFSFVLGQQFSDEKWAERFFTSVPLTLLHGMYTRWLKSVTRDRHGIHVNPEIIRSENRFEELVKWGLDTVLPELVAETSFDGYTREEFVRVYCAIFAHAKCLSLLEDECDSKKGRENHQGSSALILPLDRMISWVSRGSGVQIPIVGEVLDDLTFNAESLHSSFAFQPIIRTTHGIVMIPPRLFCGVHPYRVLAGAMMAGKRRKQYERIINRIEQENVERIGDQFKQLGFTVQVRPVLSSQGNEEEGAPDLLVIDNAQREVLLVEYKHSLSPVEPGMIANRLRDADGWIHKLEFYRRLIRENPQTLRHIAIDSGNVAVFPLLLFGLPMPIPLQQTSDLAIGDWISVGECLSAFPDFRLSELWSWIHERPDVRHLVVGSRVGTHQISVGEWTYERTVQIAAQGDFRP